MGFKDWPTWLKGGVILSGIYISLIILYFLSSLLANFVFPLIAGTTINEILNSIFAFSFTILIYFPTFLIVYSLSFIFGRAVENILIDDIPFFPQFTVLGYVVGVIGALFSYFIIGAIIGFIIGKIKSSREEK